ADIAALSQLGCHRDRVGWLAPRVQVENDLVHDLVGGPVVILGPDYLQHVGNGVLRQQHPAEHTLLGRDVMRRRPLEPLAARRYFGDAHPDAPPPWPLSFPRLPARECRTVLSEAADSPQRVAASGDLRCAQPVWTVCADTPPALCAAWG